MKPPCRWIGRLALSFAVATAASAAAEDSGIALCPEPLMVVHVRAEGFPLGEQIDVCGAAQERLEIFLSHAPAGFAPRLPVTVQRQDAGVAFRFTSSDGTTAQIVLDPNGREERLAGRTPGSALLVRLEVRPLPDDALDRPVRIAVSDVPVNELTRRLARAIDHRVEGIEASCDQTVSMHFRAISIRSPLRLAADLCGLRVATPRRGVIALVPAGAAEPADPPLPASERLIVELDAALSRDPSPAAAAAALTAAEAGLAALDPDRIGPEWIALALRRARHGPPADRLAHYDAAVALNAQVPPTAAHEVLEHDRALASVLAERAEARLALGLRAEALADYERAITLDAFAPELLSRAEALVPPDRRVAWWQAQRAAADRFLEAYFDGTVVPGHGEDFEVRYRLVRALSRHAVAADAVLSGRYLDALREWLLAEVDREQHWGSDHPRAADAGSELELLRGLSLTLARFPPDAALPERPLETAREAPEADGSPLDRALDRDLFDADMRAAITGRLAAAASPEERARLAVLAAEVDLLRRGAVALDAAIGNYTAALTAHAGQLGERQLLKARIEFLESLRAPRR